MKTKVLLVLFLVASIFLIGCNQNEQTEKVEQTVAKQDTAKVESKIDTTAQKAAKIEVVPDLKGFWSGKFDSRETSFSILEQNGLNFKAVITVNYRTVSKQEIEGTLDTVSNKISMKDMLHSRAKGTYSATLSEDSKSMVGVFTMNLDGKKLNFNLKKK